MSITQMIIAEGQMFCCCSRETLLLSTSMYLKSYMACETCSSSTSWFLSLCPLTHNWVWVLYTWYLTDLFLRNLWDGSSLSKIKHFSRPWISLLSLLFFCLNVKQWPSGPLTAVLLPLMPSVHEDCCCFSRIECIWFSFPFYFCGSKGWAQTCCLSL